MVNEEMYRVAWRRRHDINERALFAYIRTKLAVETKTYLNSLEGRNPQTFHITNHFNERWLLEIMRDAYTKFGLKQGKFLDEYQKKKKVITLMKTGYYCFYYCLKIYPTFILF